MSTQPEDADDQHPTEPTPITPGENPETVAAGGATVPRGDLPPGDRATQPLAPDGSPMPIDAEHHLTADPRDEGVGAPRGDGSPPPSVGDGDVRRASHGKRP